MFRQRFQQDSGGLIALAEGRKQIGIAVIDIKRILFRSRLHEPVDGTLEAEAVDVLLVIIGNSRSSLFFLFGII